MTSAEFAARDAEGRVAQAKRAVAARTKKPMETDGRGHPATTEIDYTMSEVEFFKAVDDWKMRTGRRYPTLSEILGIARGIGYAKNVEPIDLEKTQEFDTAALARAIAEADGWDRMARDPGVRTRKLREIIDDERARWSARKKEAERSEAPARPGVCGAA